jgi:hypothetical protein
MGRPCIYYILTQKAQLYDSLTIPELSGSSAI